MATYFVSSGGDNSDGLTWAKAYTSLAGALAVASTDGDVVVIQYDGVPSTDSSLSSDTGYTTLANIAIVSASADDTGTAYTPTAMGTTNYIGHPTLNRSITLLGAYTFYIYGVTFKLAGGSTDYITLGGADGTQALADNCLFDLSSSSSAGAAVQPVGPAASAACTLRDCQFKFGNAGHTITCNGGYIRLEGCSLVAGSTAPDYVFKTSGAGTTEGGALDVLGCDFSLQSSQTLVVSNNTAFPMNFVQCRLGASTTIVSFAGYPNKAGAQVYLFDCDSGDVHINFGYYNAFGHLISNTTTYFTAGAAAQSWAIHTTTYANPKTPFETPWIDLYNADTSTAITPYIECLRNNGTATNYSTHEVWADFAAKTSSGYTISTIYSDSATVKERLTAGGSAQATGTTGWTNPSPNSPAYFKCDAGSSFTPAEVGYIRGRICVGVASLAGTLFIDPQIRT